TQGGTYHLPSGSRTFRNSVPLLVFEKYREPVLRGTQYQRNPCRFKLYSSHGYLLPFRPSGRNGSRYGQKVRLYPEGHISLSYKGVTANPNGRRLLFA